jgi:hypothetical protein
VEQKGSNDRRSAELEAAAKLVTSQGQTDRARLGAESDRVREQARADGVRAVGLANADAEKARLDAYRDLPAEVLWALAAEKVAENLPQVRELTVTPDVVTKLIGRLAGAGGEQ